MQPVLVPRDVGGTEARVLVAGPSTLAQGNVAVRANATLHPIAAWTQTRGIAHHLLRLAGLTAGTRYPLTLVVDGTPVAEAVVTTLPPALPGPGQKPFTILLGSCYCRARDEGGGAAHAYQMLSKAAEPDVHVWAGDQVYLDSPWSSFLRVYSKAELESLFRANYALTWDASHGSSSLGAVLAKASNYCTSDDHEFWNNAPNIAAYVFNSLTQSGRDSWKTIATDFYRAFQTDDDELQLRVGPVSLRMADVRIHRDADEERFMTDLDMQRLCNWLASLTGPGILVLGQLVFDRPAGFMGHLKDWGLVDYEQYATLARALAAVRHSVIVLTGDVHFGRVASTQLNTGGELIEVIASPLALVDDKARGEWKAAPSPFPPIPIPGVVTSPVATQPFESEVPHFLTLELSAKGTSTKLVVRYWPIPSSASGWGTRVFERTLH